MRLLDAGELPLLDILRRRFGKRAPGLILGIGDDSAVIKPRGRNLLLTTDMMVEGVHFDLAWITPFQLGYKLVSVNVSDVYAMGGRPEYMLLNFAARRDFDLEKFYSLFDGIEAALNDYKLALVGGDISSADKVVLSATLVGSASKYLGRGGAKPGDLIYVTGSLGDSACGLRILREMNRSVEIEKGKKSRFGPGWETTGPLIRRHVMPCAVKPDRFLRKATAMIDISDGLFIDLSRLCRESKVGARIYAGRVPISAEMKKAADYFRVDPLALATGGGEDYELLFTAPAGKKVDAHCIGEITKAGLRLIDKDGKSSRVPIKGYQHFAY